jgi:nitrogen fixation protein NifB
MNIEPYIADIVRLNVSHVTITVNAIDPDIGVKIYSWVRYGRRLLRAEEGVKILLEKQAEAIIRLKKNGVTVKVNSIIIPGVNDGHIPAIAQKMAEMKVDILNCVPYYPNEGSAFQDIAEPSKEMISEIRKRAAKYIPQMHHCTRCRADAVGLLGEIPNPEFMNILQKCERLPDNVSDDYTHAPRGKAVDEKRPYTAVASMEGILINQHLGEAAQLFVYGMKDGNVSLIETRRTPEPGTGMKRWEALSESIRDCRTLLVSGIGDNPRQVLTAKGLEIMVAEGMIEDAVKTVFEGGDMSRMTKRRKAACGELCSGAGNGCG